MNPAKPEGPLRDRLSRPVAPYSLALYRILFGAILAVAPLRSWHAGWIEEIYLVPSYHFTYQWFSWVEPLPPLGMYAAFLLLALLGVCLCMGYRTRWVSALYCLIFTYVELIEKSAYLNHYYFVSLMSLLLSMVDAGQVWSMDAVIRRRKARIVPPPPPSGPTTLGLGVVRVQVGVVYFFAGLAKLNADWLFSGEPLHTWLAAYADLPLVGNLLSDRSLAMTMSSLGALFDLTAPFGLSFRRTRGVYFCAVVVFHVITWLLFPIGIFPWVMIVSATLFFPGDWPLQFWRCIGRRTTDAHGSQLQDSRTTASPRLAVPVIVTAALYCGLQVVLPLRFLAYPGDVDWTERGFRFAWRVMLVEKSGLVEYHVVRTTLDGVRTARKVSPRLLLSPLQYRMMRTQPDMIAEFGQELARRSRERSPLLPGESLEVHADAWVSHNGRRAARLVCPHVDLSAGIPTDPGWISARSGTDCVSLQARSP